MAGARRVPVTLVLHRTLSAALVSLFYSMIEPEERTLEQRHFGTQHRLEILDTGVRVTARSFFSSHSVEVPFEEITANAMTYSRGARPWLILAGSCMALAALGAFLTGAADLGVRGVAWSAGFAGLGIAMLVAFAATRQHRILLSNGSPGLDFLQDRPNLQTTEAFVENIRHAQQAYLRNNYGMGGPMGTNIELIERLAYLKDHDAITAEEYETLKAEIITRAKWSVPRDDIEPNGSYL